MMAMFNAQTIQQQAPSLRENAKRFGLAGLLTGAVFGFVQGNGMADVLQMGALVGAVFALGGAVAGEKLTALTHKVLVKILENPAAQHESVQAEALITEEVVLDKVPDCQPMGLSHIDPTEAVCTQDSGGIETEYPLTVSRHLPPEWVSPNAAGKRPTHESSAMRH